MATLNGCFVHDSFPAEIVARVREWIDIMGRDGRPAMGIANTPADAPLANILMAVRATHRGFQNRDDG